MQSAPWLILAACLVCGTACNKQPDTHLSKRQQRSEPSHLAPLTIVSSEGLHTALSDTSLESDNPEDDSTWGLLLDDSSSSQIKLLDNTDMVGSVDLMPVR